MAITANWRVPEFTTRKWVEEKGNNGIEAPLDQEVKFLKKKGSSDVRVTSGPLIIEFEHLLLRVKRSPQEVDIDIDDNDLEDWADYA